MYSFAVHNSGHVHEYQPIDQYWGPRAEVDVVASSEPFTCRLVRLVSARTVGAVDRVLGDTPPPGLGPPPPYS
jgi:hypothetical protein